MKNNPLIPYVLIMAFGIGLIFFLSLEGAGNKEEAAEGEGGATEEISGEAIAQSCIGCHGGDLGGQGNAPALTGGLDAAHVKEVVMNGQGAMPAIVTNEAEAQAVADYIAGLE